MRQTASQRAEDDHPMRVRSVIRIPTPESDVEIMMETHSADGA